MKKLSLAALMIVAAGAAMAEDRAPDAFVAEAVSSKTRAQVVAELEQGRRDGSIKAATSTFNPLRDARSLKTRDEVKAELAEAKASGEFAVLNSEDGGVALVAQSPRKQLPETLARAR